MQNDIWKNLFREADKDGSARLTFSELEATIRGLAGPRNSTRDPLVRGVTRGDLKALWAIVDVDKSGEVTAAEWHLCLYRLEVETWPEGDDIVARVILEM